MARGAVVLLGCAWALSGAPGASAAAGDLDPGFSGDGRVSLPAAGSFVPRAVALQRDGRIVVAGASCRPDPAVQDGTCLDSGDASFRLARFTRDGGLDPEFGDGGFVTAQVGAGRSQAFDVAVVPSGAIVAAGVARDADGRDEAALARFDARGALDRSFGSGGVALQPLGRTFSALTVLSEGPRGTLVGSGQADGRMVIARFTARGALDPRYGDGGFLTLGTPYSYGLGLAVDGAGAVVAAGIAADTPDPAGFRFGAARLTARGRPDPRFGGRGWIEQRPGSGPSFANAAAPLPADGWLAAGAATLQDGRQAMAVVRGTRTGRAAWTSIVLFGDGAVANDVIGQGDGRTLAVGQVAPAQGGLTFGVARLRRDGHLDPGFGHEGIATVDWPEYPWARATAGALQPDGRLVTAGLGCAGGDGGLRCHGGTAVLLLARQLGDPGGPPPALDVERPAVRLAHLPGRLRVARLAARGLAVRVHIGERARVTARLGLRRRGAGRWTALARTRSAAARKSLTVRLRPAPARLRHVRAGTLRLRLRVVDLAGNATTVRARIRLH